MILLSVYSQILIYFRIYINCGNAQSIILGITSTLDKYVLQLMNYVQCRCAALMQKVVCIIESQSETGTSTLHSRSKKTSSKILWKFLTSLTNKKQPLNAAFFYIMLCVFLKKQSNIFIQYLGLRGFQITEKKRKFAHSNLPEISCIYFKLMSALGGIWKEIMRNTL